MVMIQDGPQNTGADKPLRISGEPFKVQVSIFMCNCGRCLILCLHRDQSTDELNVLLSFLASQRDGDGADQRSGLQGAEGRVRVKGWRGR